MKKTDIDWENLPIVLIAIAAVLLFTALFNTLGLFSPEDPLPELKAETLTEEDFAKREEIFEETVIVEEQAAPEISDRDIIAMVVMAEAGGEKYIGKVAVAAVALNRASQRGMTIEQVATEEGQFVYPYRGTVSAACYEAVDYAMEHRDLFPANMLYFRNFKYHENLGVPYIQIGGHYFSTEGIPEWELEALGGKD